MSNRTRVAITVVTALILGAFAYGESFDVNPPGILYDIWNSPVAGVVVYALAVLGVFLVYRWWALLPAVAPSAVTIYLHEFTDYTAPWRDESWGFSDYPFWFVVFAVAGIVIQAAFLSLGLVFRAIWESICTKRRGRSLTGAV